MNGEAVKYQINTGSVLGLSWKINWGHRMDLMREGSTLPRKRREGFLEGREVQVNLR